MEQPSYQLSKDTSAIKTNQSSYGTKETFESVSVSKDATVNQYRYSTGQPCEPNIHMSNRHMDKDVKQKTRQGKIRKY